MSYRIVNVEQNSEQWFKEREKKITGSRFGKIYNQTLPLKDKILEAIRAQGNEVDPKLTIPKLLPLLSEDSWYGLFKDGEQKREFWKLVAEWLFTVPDIGEEGFQEDPREGGHRKEPIAIARFEQETGLKTSNVGLVVNEQHEGIAISPDAVIFDKVMTEINGRDEEVDWITGAVETKNFENAHHAEAVVTNRIPKEIWPQILQYFIAIDTLNTLYVVFHSQNTPYVRLQYKCFEVKRKDIADKIQAYKDYELRALRYVDEIVSEYVGDTF